MKAFSRPYGLEPSMLVPAVAILVLSRAPAALGQERVSTARGVVYHDQNGNGLNDAGEPGVADVSVSNGREVVSTDAEGRYSLPVTDDTIVFVIKPVGWMTPTDESHIPRFWYVHKPAGSPKSRYPGVDPTGPLPESIEFPLMPNEEPDKFKVILLGDPQPRNQTEIDYLAHDSVEELIGTDCAWGMSLGDVVFDDLSLYPSLSRTLGVLEVPWYNVHGNHDMNYDSPDDEHADETWERAFGPSYYSFNYARVHFIALDDVVWLGPSDKGTANYRGGLGEKQLEFIRRDLAVVPKENLIVLTMHIPLEEVQNRGELFDLLSDRPNTFSISAHYHINKNEFYGSSDGWRGPIPHHHLVQGTACGSWWTGAPDERGIPHSTMRDGTPTGYSIATFDGNQYSVKFKAARRPPTHQMNLYAPDSVNSSEIPTVYVMANVFAGSSRSRVEIRVGEAGDWKPMRQVRGRDPGYLALLAAEQELGEFPWRKLRDAVECPHLWREKLPGPLPVGAHRIEVRTTDMFGHTYQANRVIRVTP